MWGQRWSRRTLEEHEVDLNLLLWPLEKDAKPEAFGDAPTGVELSFPEQPAHKRTWWYRNESGRCELCIEPPERSADVYVSTSLVDTVRIWRGDVRASRAIDEGLLASA